jgi:hypothetical protein
MIRRLRDAFGGGTGREAADAAVGRGLADVLAALDNVIDDDAVLGRICAGLGTSVPGAAPGRGAGTAAGGVCARTGMCGPAITTARASGPAASRRRLALRSATAVAAALTAGAVALAAAGVPGARHNGTGLTAYVVKRVDSALSAAEPGEIAQMTVTTRSVMLGGTTTTTAEEWSFGDQWRSVANSPTGHPVYDEGASTASVYTLVSYLTQTWARQPGLRRPAAPVSGCESAAAVPLVFQPGLLGTGFSARSLPVTVARALRAAVSCGTLAVAGRQRIDGIEAIELTSRSGSLISETIWVNPGTYLPVRVVVRPAPGAPALLTADISWLPPTAQNLAKLTVPIPAGFRQVPLAQAVTSILQQIPGGQPKGVSVPGSGLEHAGHSRLWLRRGARWPFPALRFSCPTSRRQSPGDVC